MIKIGVLGGIGPEASAEFYHKLIKKLQEEKLIKNNQDYPQIIINSIPGKELINVKVTNDDLKEYIQGLKELELLNPDFMVMVCNTVHLFLNSLQKEIKTPILDLRKEVEFFLKKGSIKSVFVIGTPFALNEGLYKFEGITSLIPEVYEQKVLSKCIFNFNKGRQKEEQIKKAKEICLKYLNEGVETVILGCTEFAVMLEKENFPKVDTLDILVDSVIAKVKKMN